MMDNTDMQSDISSALESASAETTSGPVESASPSTPSQSSRPSQGWEATLEKTAANIADRELPEIAAPGNWKQDLDWKGLPRSVQEHIAQRETEYQRGMTKYGEDYKLAKGINDLIDQFQQGMPEHYRAIPKHEQIQFLYAAQDMLTRDPVSAIQWLAQAHGVDLGQFGPGAQRVSQIEQQHQRLHQERQQYIQQEVQNFVKDKPYWPQIEDEVVRQVNAIRETNPSLWSADPLTVMRQAHDTALKVTGVQSKLDAVEAKKKADEAKRLASLNVRSAMGRSPSNISNDMWSNDNWGAAYDKATNR